MSAPTAALDFSGVVVAAAEDDRGRGVCAHVFTCCVAVDDTLLQVQHFAIEK